MSERRPTRRSRRPKPGRLDIARIEALPPQFQELLDRPSLPADAFDRLGDVIDELQQRPVRTPEFGFEIPKDFEGPSINPELVLDLADQISSIDTPPIAGALDAVSVSIIDVIALTTPDVLPREPLPEGAKGARLPLPDKVLTPLLSRAAMELSQSAERVVWDDGVNQLIVDLGKIEAELGERRITVIIPVACDQVRTTMRVPFATGGEGRNAGMVLATADRPVGDGLIARTWGEALIALAHSTLLSVISSLAGASGRDEHNDTLVPRSLHVEGGLLSIETEARRRFRTTLK